MFNAHEVNAILNDAGIKTLGVVITDEPTLEDDEITVTENVRVQVGDSYLGVSVDNGDGTFTMHPFTEESADITNTLKKLVL